MRKLSLPAMILIALSCTATHAEDWPQWRGPELNGTSREKNCRYGGARRRI